MGLPSQKFTSRTIESDMDSSAHVGGIVLSDEARGDANSFWQTQKGISSVDSTSTNIYMKRMRVMLGSLGGIILLLAVALVFVATNSDFQVGSAAAPLLEASAVKIVVAKENISVGTKIRLELLDVKEVSASVVPDNALLESDLTRVIDKYAARLIAAGGPVNLDDVTNASMEEPAFKIPAGYRAVTLDVGGRTGGEGFVRAGAKVDVLWFYAAEGDEQKVTTIVSGAKVLSVNANKSKVIDSATLLVSKKESHVIELSRNLGSLSLSLVGEEEAGAQLAEESEIVTIKDILKEEEAPAPVEGRIEVVDPKTGERSSFVLSNNRLRAATSDSNETFTSVMNSKKSVEEEMTVPEENQE